MPGSAAGPWPVGRSRTNGPVQRKLPYELRRPANDEEANQLEVRSRGKRVGGPIFCCDSWVTSPSGLFDSVRDCVPTFIFGRRTGQFSEPNGTPVPQREALALLDSWCYQAGEVALSSGYEEEEYSHDGAKGLIINAFRLQSSDGPTHAPVRWLPHSDILVVVLADECDDGDDDEVAIPGVGAFCPGHVAY